MALHLFCFSNLRRAFVWWTVVLPFSASLTLSFLTSQSSTHPKQNLKSRDWSYSISRGLGSIARFSFSKPLFLIWIWVFGYMMLNIFPTLSWIDHLGVNQSSRTISLRYQIEWAFPLNFATGISALVFIQNLSVHSFSKHFLSFVVGEVGTQVSP